MQRLTRPLKSFMPICAGDFLLAFLQEGLRQHAVAVHQRAEAMIARGRRLQRQWCSSGLPSGPLGKQRAARTDSGGARSRDAL